MTSNTARNLDGSDPAPFSAHPGMQRAYRTDGMTIGYVTPLEGFAGPLPTMTRHTELVQQAEAAGVAQLWVRDVPLLDPSFGDTGQVFDSFTYLGYLAAITETVALGSAAAVATLRSPIDVAKAAASVDQLSGGRFVLGLASGDRPSEFPAFGRQHSERGREFRDSVEAIRRLLGERFPQIHLPGLKLDGQVDLVPKPSHGRLPLFVTGTCRQTMEWIAEHADGWMYYMLPIQQQAENIEAWRAATAPRGEVGWKPYHQYTFIDLAENPIEAPSEIPQGLRLGREPLLAVLDEWRKIGVDQVMFNFRRSSRPAAEVLDELAQYVLPEFPAGTVD